MIRRGFVGGLMVLLVPRMEYVFPKHVGEIGGIYEDGSSGKPYALIALYPPYRPGKKNSLAPGMDSLFLSDDLNFPAIHTATFPMSKYAKVTDWEKDVERRCSGLMCRKSEAGVYIDGRWVRITNNEGTVETLHQLSGVML